MRGWGAAATGALFAVLIAFVAAPASAASPVAAGPFANWAAIVVISACFSGVFVPALAGDQRMILTAARPDRTSFGCGESDKYPYFDDCFLSSAPQARDFLDLGAAV